MGVVGIKPLWVPPPPKATRRFVLPKKPNPGTADEIHEWKGEIESAVRGLFQAIALEYGESETRRLFRDVATRQRQGRPLKSPDGLVVPAKDRYEIAKRPSLLQGKQADGEWLRSIETLVADLRDGVSQSFGERGARQLLKEVAKHPRGKRGKTNARKVLRLKNHHC
jgi:hypothetical protein